jgi:DMSO/TMAO reductase YedYZ molybdopterin-dependent catalytic subunit
MVKQHYQKLRRFVLLMNENYIDKDKDCVVAITGTEREGKSTLALWLVIFHMLLQKSNIDLEKNIGYRREENIDKIKALPPKSGFIADEAILMAYKMNDIQIPPERGFPFMLVAESKWGYKWIKWITEIELSDNISYRGYWESSGYSNSANLSEDFFEQ